MMRRYLPLLPLLLVAACLDDLALVGDGSGDDAGSTNDAGDAGVGTDGTSEFADVVEPDADFSNFEPLNVRFEPSADGFYRMPWPSDYRTSETGSPVLSDFPRSGNGLVGSYRRAIESGIVGFSTLPVFYAAIDADPGIESLPDPDETIYWDSVVQLVELGEGCGTRVPLEVDYRAEGDTFLDDSMLRAAPVPGFYLKPATTYAFVVLRTFGNDAGLSASAGTEFEQAMSGTHSDAALNASFAPLRSCMPSAALFESTIAVASVFTTQDPVFEMRAIRDFVMDPARVESPEIVEWTFSEEDSTDRYDVWYGLYRTPVFQQGNSPYTSTGGGISFDETGAPVVARYEDVPFSIAWPADAEGPLPVMLWVDGTGADQTSHIGDDPFVEAIRRGFAVANYQPQFHSGRAGQVGNEELSTFNYVNPEAGRNVFRQQAADTVYFLRLLRESAADLEGVPELIEDQIVYGGHSQGALIGVMVAAIEDSFRGFFLNGVGATLSITIVERSDPFDIRELIGQFLGVAPEGIDRMHPVVQLAQLGGDVVEPGNYARYWAGWDTNPGGNHVLFTNGNEDTTTPVGSVNSLIIASDAAPIAPPGWEVDPHEVWDRSAEQLPIEGNRVSLDGSPLTIAALLAAGNGHFTIYRQDNVMKMGGLFWETAIGSIPFVELD